MAIHKAKSKENVEFYNVLRLLGNSINNAGCEDRRSEQIDLINKASQKITDNYEGDLP